MDKQGFSDSFSKPIKLKTTNRPPLPRSLSALPTGPRMFADRQGRNLSGPGDPPNGFVHATNSASEWLMYWGLAKVFADPKDPREQPFYGSRDPSLWRYQYSYDLGRHQIGGSVVDFVCFPYGIPVLMRLQTEYFHVFADAKKQAYDALQKQRLASFGHVEDVWEDQLLDSLKNDPSGQGIVQMLKRQLQGPEAVDPLLTGQTRRIRK